MFNELKAAQVAAFFLGQDAGKTMPYIKLMRLMYLSDREAVRVFGHPISGDDPVSTHTGPALSRTLGLMMGNESRGVGVWAEWIASTASHEVFLRHNFDIDALDRLSRAETDVLKAVWKEFGAMDCRQICDWTLQFCVEWKGAGRPIRYEDMVRAVGYDEASAKEIAAQILSKREVDLVFAAL